MSSTAPSNLTTDVSTDGLSTSMLNSTIMSSVNTVQVTSISTASAATTQSSANSKDMSTVTSVGTTTSTASFTTSDNSTSSTGNTTSVYSVTTDDISGNMTSTTALLGSNVTTSSTDSPTTATHVPVSSQPPESSRSTRLTQQTSNVTTAGTKYCTEPLLITGGKLLTTGPYLANISSAIYSCFDGYTMTGHAEITCSNTGSWDKQPPRCSLPVNKPPKVDNHISLSEDSTSVPLWLMVILCLAFGLLCLLLLACLLVYCLKIFGCWKGSSVGTKTMVRRMGTESSGTMIADDFGSNGRYSRPKNFSYEENEERFRSQPYNTSSRIPVKSTGQGLMYGSGPYNQYSRGVNFPHERGEGPNSHRPVDNNADQNTGRLYRREAKMPARQTWMPHSRNFRNINTSTK